MQAERDNERRARHDPLTGLANRTGLQHAFDARRADGGQAIFYLDLNGFKAVNDRLGHAAGDQLLVAVADRLRALDWPDLFVSRVGGDEFVLIAPMLEEAVARRLSEAIVATISDDLYPIENVRVPIGVSVGVAFARAGDELRTIMSSADKALYASKSASARPTRAA
nr:GGDEF domain-containing protein [Sphingomonas quercus]